MFSWLKLGLLLLSIADKFLDIARAKQLIGAGEDRQIAKASASILIKTQAAKEIEEHIIPLTEEQTDQELKDLEPE